MMPKQEKRAANNVLTMPTTEPSVPASDVGDGDVARRAYDLYCARGFQDGHDVDDWLAAERDLQKGRSFSAA
ncbi:MAG: DUF2934 domain-containing protein [Thermoanaerobaculia bacterium]